MTTLALDLGTTWGYAFDTGKYGSYKTKMKTTDSQGKKFDGFDNWLKEHLPGVTQVYFEEVKRHVGTEAAHVYGAFRAILFMNCYRMGIPYQGIGVGTIKKTYTGKGNAQKLDMIREAERRGHFPKDDNSADALAILYTGKLLYEDKKK